MPSPGAPPSSVFMGCYIGAIPTPQLAAPSESSSRAAPQQLHLDSQQVRVGRCGFALTKRNSIPPAKAHARSPQLRPFCTAGFEMKALLFVALAALAFSASATRQESECPARAPDPAAAG